MAIDLRVRQNGDDVFLSWRVDEHIHGCLGFAIMRKVGSGRWGAIPSYAGFEDQTWKRGESRRSTAWPIQKFWWTDFGTRPGDVVQYRVVAMLDDGAGGLRRSATDVSEPSAPVLVSHDMGQGFACYFNRGVVASQWLQRLLGQDLTLEERKKKLDDVVDHYGDDPTARNLMAGELRVGLVDLLQHAGDQPEVTVRAVLFELTDPELLELLRRLGPRLEVVLSDGSQEVPNDAPPPKTIKVDENEASRRELEKAGATVHSRMCNIESDFLGHNKFVVVTDEHGEPDKVWTGSTNFTPTGLCTQVNNGILIEDRQLARQFWDQAGSLARAGSDAPDWLVDQNSHVKVAEVGSAPVHVWFTRTQGFVDLAEARERIAAAEQGALFLMFQSGLGDAGLLKKLLERGQEKGFFCHGIISSQPQEGPRPKRTHPPTHAETLAEQIGFVHKNEPVEYAPNLLLPFAREKATEKWIDEFVKKNGAYAIVHSKVIVLDPFGDEPVVMTGSHNLGTTASSENDENLLLISRQPALAAAYAAHIMAVYDNFRWRYRLAAGSKWDGSKRNTWWQNAYLRGRVPEFDFFTPATPA